MPTYLLYAVLGINVLTFSLFGVDKWLARAGRRRVPELHLLGLSWATGLIGGWIAMSVFRHKTQKTSFRLKMALVTVLNLLWLVLYLGSSSS